MTAGLHGVLTTTELEDANLFAAAVGKNRSRNGSAFNGRTADGEAGLVANSEHFSESNLGADFSFDGFDLELVADVDAVLLTASLDNSVHCLILARSAPSKIISGVRNLFVISPDSSVPEGNLR